MGPADWTVPPVRGRPNEPDFAKPGSFSPIVMLIVVPLLLTRC